MAMKTTIYKTECQREREARDLALYNEYHKLMAIPGQSATMVHKVLREKYNIHSQGTIYVILKRVEESINQKQQEDRR